MRMSRIIRCCAFVIASFVVFIFAEGDHTECDLILQNTENNYLAQTTLRNVFASFHEIFNTVSSSDEYKQKLDEKAIRFAELLVAAKRIELEIKAIDENKLNRTIEELCHESSPNTLWLKFILKTEIELQTLLREAINEPDIDYRPRPG